MYFSANQKAVKEYRDYLDAIDAETVSDEEKTAKRLEIAQKYDLKLLSGGSASTILKLMHCRIVCAFPTSALSGLMPKCTMFTVVFTVKEISKFI